MLDLTDLFLTSIHKTIQTIIHALGQSCNGDLISSIAVKSAVRSTLLCTHTKLKGYVYWLFLHRTIKAD